MLKIDQIKAICLFIDRLDETIQSFKNSGLDTKDIEKLRDKYNNTLSFLVEEE